jgi:hypothetical protein
MIPEDRIAHPWNGVDMWFDDFDYYPDGDYSALSLVADLGIFPLTIDQVAEVLDAYRCSGCRVREIEWKCKGDIPTGELILRGVPICTYDWVSEWLNSGKQAIEWYLRWLGDPRFPMKQDNEPQDCLSGL